jgi:4-hydroxy-tetrahydrodipicolinate reductase
MSDLRIGVTGCRGRMGKMIVETILETPGCVLSGGTAAPHDEAVGLDLGELAGAGRRGAAVTDDPVTLFAASDAVIDFSSPGLTRKHADLAAQSEVAYVLGTTGLDEAAQDAVNRAARHTQVIQAPNMSLGVNLLMDLVEQVARALDPAFDIEVQEMHHRHKVDAPSGTALALGRAAAEGRGVDLDAVADRGRDGITGARESGHIGFAVLRGGDVPGEHTVTFAGTGERIELTHKAGSRAIFAQGAVKAAIWANRQDPGIYDMKDVLGLR